MHRQLHEQVYCDFQFKTKEGGVFMRHCNEFSGCRDIETLNIQDVGGFVHLIE